MPKTKKMGFNLVYRDLDSLRRGPRFSAQGTLTQISGAASRGPLRCELRSHVAPQVEV